jgi:hypothetical protein
MITTSEQERTDTSTAGAGAAAGGGGGGGGAAGAAAAAAAAAAAGAGGGGGGGGVDSKKGLMKNIRHVSKGEAHREESSHPKKKTVSEVSVACEPHNERMKF